MKFITYKTNGLKIAELDDKNFIINKAQDFLDLIANALSNKIIVRKENITEEFFDLKTGLAGEIFQKASNYRIRFGIIGDFSGYTSQSLKDLIYESNKTGQVVFTDSMDDMIKIFS